MNKEQTAKILKIICSVYGGNEPDELTVSVWQMIMPEPFEMVSRALQEYLRVGKYPPKPADLLEIMHRNETNAQSAEEAWCEIRSAYMGLYSDTDYADAERAWKRLPKAAQKLVTPRDLIDYAFRCTSKEVNQFEKPRFIKAYENTQEQEKKQALGTHTVMQIADRDVKKIA